MNMQLQQRGFTIVEAMITFLILSVGLLGMAGLQTKGLQMGQNSYQRSQAAVLAQDIAERMRANAEETIENSSYKVALGVTPTASTNCVTDNCTPGAMAEFDLEQWKTSLQALLPNGDGKIEIDSDGATTATATVSVYWDEYRNGATAGNCPPQNETEMACFAVTTSLAKAP